MKRFLTVAASVAVVAGVGLATAATSANAATKAKPSIRTYTEQATVMFHGIGPDRGYLSAATGSETVALAPRLALRSATSTELEGAIVGSHRTTGHFDIVDGRGYQQSGNGPWHIKTLSAASLRQYQRQLNPAVAMGKFFALHNIRRLSGTHYSVTGSFAAVEPFLSWEYGLTSKNFGGAGIKALTVNVWTNRDGWPVKITVTGQSGTLAFSATETFAHYNKPVTITVP